MRAAGFIVCDHCMEKNNTSTEISNLLDDINNASKRKNFIFEKIEINVFKKNELKILIIKDPNSKFIFFRKLDSSDLSVVLWNFLLNFGHQVALQKAKETTAKVVQLML